MDWMKAEAPSLEEVEVLARVCFSELPSEFRELTGDITFVVQDLPDSSVIEDMELESEFEILGLFHGPDLAARDQGHGAETTMIFLFRRPILDYWCENADSLGAIIRHVLIHEIGHHFGLSDDAMDAIEARD